MIVFNDVKHHVKVFTFLKILGDGRMRRGGGDESEKNSWFILKKIFFRNDDDLIEYCFDHKNDEIDVYKSGHVTGSFHRKDVVDAADLVLNALKTSQNPFLVPSVREFLDKIGYMEVAKNDADESSLSLVMYDPQTNMDLKYNYRILSEFTATSENN